MTNQENIDNNYNEPFLNDPNNENFQNDFPNFEEENNQNQNESFLSNGIDEEELARMNILILLLILRGKQSFWKNMF